MAVSWQRTSLFRLDVSMPTALFRSTSNVLVPSLAANLRAIARPTAPPPMTACVKSALTAFVLLNGLEVHAPLVLRSMATLLIHRFEIGRGIMIGIG